MVYSGKAYTKMDVLGVPPFMETPKYGKNGGVFLGLEDFLEKNVV